MHERENNSLAIKALTRAVQQYSEVDSVVSDRIFFECRFQEGRASLRYWCVDKFHARDH